MLNSMLKKILFFIVMVIYLAIPFYMIMKYNKVLNEGHVYRFRPQPVDPYDAFRGKYITLYFLQNSVSYDTSEYKFHRGDNIYLSLEKDSAGYAVFSKAYKNAPKDMDYIKTTVRYVWDKSVSFEIPFNRYYLPEEMAAKAENIYFENVRRVGESQDSSVYVDVRVSEGKGLIEELYFKGIPVKEYIHQQEGSTQN